MAVGRANMGCVSPCPLHQVKACTCRSTPTDAGALAHVDGFSGLLQGSGRRTGVAISMAMFAKERLSLWWRLPGSRTTSGDVQRNGCTSDTRFRCTLGHARSYTPALDSHINKLVTQQIYKIKNETFYFKRQVGGCLWRQLHKTFVFFCLYIQF